MAKNNIVLDTSGVIAFLCNEEGADVVEGHLNKAKKGNVGSLHLFCHRRRTVLKRRQEGRKGKGGILHGNHQILAGQGCAFT